MILLRNYFINTSDAVDVISIIHEVNRAAKEAKVTEGLVTVSIPAPGAAVTILEPLPEIVAQFKEAVRVFPGEGMETKNRRKEEIAVGPRVVAAMLGKSLQIPMSDGRLMLAPREEVVLIDLEKSGRRREFYVQVFGDSSEGASCPKAAPPQKT